jgi:branched-chain amino acid transport system ATP-binding protein
MLSMNNVQVNYGGSRALRGVTLKVQEGSIVVLIGANGAGKTTTLRAIIGLSPITSGEIWFLKSRIDRARSSEIVKMGLTLVPEGRRVFPFMTVSENLIMGAFCRNDRDGIKNSREEILEQFPVLKRKLRQRAGTLSGGEQQMLAIGRGLMAKPKLLLLDEPTLGLSPILVEEIERIIQRINQMRVAITLVEQNAQMALRLAHRGYVLETGRITVEGEVEELLQNKHVKEAFLGG